MQENHKNGQDDSDIVETSKHFTITPGALNRHMRGFRRQTKWCPPPGLHGH